ncbi:MAG: hypothetical protein R2710_00030 [Acidimicrobiales bacterium]
MTATKTLTRRRQRPDDDPEPDTDADLLANYLDDDDDDDGILTAAENADPNGDKSDRCARQRLGWPTRLPRRRGGESTTPVSAEQKISATAAASLAHWPPTTGSALRPPHPATSMATA